MLFHKQNKTLRNLNLSINGRTNDQVKIFYFLGRHLNSQLTWHTHIKEFSKKNSRITKLIYEMQNILPSKIPLSLYNTLIFPHINYCTCILSWCKENNSIFLLQKTCRSCYCFSWIQISL